MAAGSELEIVVGESHELAELAATRLEAESRRALAERNRFVVALAGGSMAERLFPRLARAPFDLERTEFFWADERAVPPDHPDSNFRLARRLWLDAAGVPAAHIHRMPADAIDLQGAAERYGRELEAVAGAPPRLDAALLGVGPDGHVASIFPNADALAGARRTVLAVTDAPKPPPRRLTLSLQVLAAAGLVVVAAFGRGKAAAIAAALDDCSRLPVALLRRSAGRVLVLLDADAAAGVDPAPATSSDGCGS